MPHPSRSDKLHAAALEGPLNGSTPTADLTLIFSELSELKFLLQQIQQSQAAFLESREMLASRSNFADLDMPGTEDRVEKPASRASISAGKVHKSALEKVVTKKSKSPKHTDSENEIHGLAQWIRHEASRVPAMLLPADKKYRNCLDRLVNSGAFEALCMVAVLSHSLYMGAVVDCEVRAAVFEGLLDGDCDSSAVEVAFLTFYVVELSMKLGAWRCYFFTGREAWWNVFDVVLVGSGVISLLLDTKIGIAAFIDAPPEMSSHVTDFVWMRSLRIVRQAVRSLRILRVVKHFKELRILMISILNSMNVFFWAMVTLGMLIYMWSIFFVGAIATSVQRGTLDEEMTKAVLDNWSTMSTGMLTLFRSVTGGAPWGAAAAPLHATHPIYLMFFLLYIAILLIAVLKLLTGMFIRHAEAAASLDQDRLIHRTIQELFDEIDEDHSGTICLDGFLEKLEDPISRMHLEFLKIDATDAERLFHLIDVNGDEKIDIEEFITGCQSYKGYAKKLDVNLIMNQISMLSRSLDVCIDHILQ
eukprot:TRINITY_DN54928_c0_g1_i1.p1 TRINITY_DN54928_c0_g1~~TRINITY_DN54928_c0_g1_i1.p1  ORF type:complete len:531 (+),score=107.49 TRINITY_DN54928_c0_g1_i1:26-1618(+)